MAQRNDPGALFGQLLNQWEEAANELANKVMGTPEFSKGMNTATMASLRMRELMHEQMSRVLEVTNMPSRSELSDLHSAVDRMATRLDSIDEKLARLLGDDSARAQSSKSPPRSKMPPAKGDKQNG